MWWGRLVSVSFLRFCIAACLVFGTALSALKMSAFCFFRVLCCRWAEMRERFKGACLCAVSSWWPHAVWINLMYALSCKKRDPASRRCSTWSGIIGIVKRPSFTDICYLDCCKPSSKPTEDVFPVQEPGATFSGLILFSPHELLYCSSCFFQQTR